MKKRILFTLLVLIFHEGISQKNRYIIHTVAFYNLENLFDTINNPNKNDEASPIMQLKNNRSGIYFKKLENLANVISKIGVDKTNTTPTLLGVSEIENRTVLEDLIHTDILKSKNYGIVHCESPDNRGIDVALLYNKLQFTPIHHISYELKLWSEEGYRIATRDQLLVSGYLENELIHLIVNHWPSRRGGQKKSNPLREKAALLNKKICDSLLESDPDSKIIIMGDLNDNPTNSSLKNILQTETNLKNLNDTIFFNPYEILYKKGHSTLGYRDNIHLFDQILLNGKLITRTYQNLSFYKAFIYNPQYLSNQSGRYKGYPFRSFSNGKFTDGYSDHYPVYVYLVKRVN